MKKIVFYFTLIPLLCFGQNDSDCSFGISINKYFVLQDYSHPFAWDDVLSDMWSINISKDIAIMDIPTNLSIGYINNISFNRSIYVGDNWGSYVGNYSLDLKSIPISLSYSLTKEDNLRGRLSAFYGVILRRGTTHVDGDYNIVIPESTPGWVDQGEGFEEKDINIVDNVYGIKYEYLLNNFALNISVESQSNNIIKSYPYGLTAFFPDDAVPDVSINGYQFGINQHELITRPLFFVFGLKYFIR